MEQQSFGYWLKLKRKALDLTREQLAERVGYSAATSRKIEDEERLPSTQVIEHLAEFRNIPPDQRHHQILQTAITSNGGAVFQIISDAFCAARIRE